MMLSRRNFLIFSALNGVPQGFALDFDAFALTLRLAQEDELSRALFAGLMLNNHFRENGFDVKLEILPKKELITCFSKNDNALTLFDFNLFVSLNEKQRASQKALFHMSDDLPLALIGRKSRGVMENIRSLEGKTVGLVEGSRSHLYLPLLLKEVKITPDTVKIETIGSNLREALLSTGEVDAILGPPPRLIPSLKAKNIPLDDLVTLNYRDYGLPLYGLALLGGDKLTLDASDKLKSFFIVLTAGLQKLKNQPEPAARALILKTPSLSLELATEQLLYFLDDLILTPARFKRGFGLMDRDKLEIVGKILQQNGLEQLTDPRFSQ